MNYAGAIKTPVQCTLICTQTGVSWILSEPVTWKLCPAASVIHRPIPSISRSMGTSTRVADVKKSVTLARSSPR